MRPRSPGTRRRDFRDATDPLSTKATWREAASVYLQGPGGLRVLDWLQRNGIALHTLHASGHASVADLRALASAIDPDRVVPIHTAAPERYPDVFARVEPRADGEWWTV